MQPEVVCLLAIFINFGNIYFQCQGLDRESLWEPPGFVIPLLALAPLLNFYTCISVHIGKNMPTDDYSTDPAARSDMATHLVRGLAHHS